MIPFGQWTPDRPDQTDSARVASGVYPVADGYAPVPQLTSGADTGSERVQGGFATKDRNGTAYLFCGTATALKTLTLGAWASIGTGYSASPDSFWQFERFGDLLLATNGTDAIQQYSVMGGGSASALTDAPRARYMAVVRDMLVLADVDGDPYKWQWSGFNDAENWEAGENGSGSATIPSGGVIKGVTGGEYGLIFQEFAIQRISFTGTDAVWQRDEIESNHGLYASGSLAKYGRFNFYLSHNGFYLCDGTAARPIGDQRVDQTFFADLNRDYKARITSAIDPIKKLVLWLYPSGASTVCDKALIYNWAVDRWASASIALDTLFPAYTVGVSPDDAAFPEPLPDSGTISWDSDLYKGGSLLLAGFASDGVYKTFTGSNMAASVETGEFQPDELRRARVRGFRVVGGSTSAQGRVGYRARSGDSVSYTTLTTVDADGYVDARCEGRLLRANVQMTAGETWTRVQGVNPDMSLSGHR